MTKKLSRKFTFTDEAVQRVVTLVSDYTDTSQVVPVTDEERTNILAAITDEVIPDISNPGEVAAALMLPSVYVERMESWLLSDFSIDFIEGRNYRITVEFDM